jgi:excisionase family DNA binding protein
MEKLADLITLREASKISGYNPDYLGFLIRDGKMRGKKVGRNWLTTREDVEYYLKNLSARSLTPRKTSIFGTGFMLLAISLLVSFAVYFAYVLIYQNAYDEVSAKTASTTSSTATQTDQIVQNILQ